MENGATTRRRRAKWRSMNSASTRFYPARSTNGSRSWSRRSFRSRSPKEWSSAAASAARPTIPFTFGYAASKARPSAKRNTRRFMRATTGRTRSDRVYRIIWTLGDGRDPHRPDREVDDAIGCSYGGRLHSLYNLRGAALLLLQGQA